MTDPYRIFVYCLPDAFNQCELSDVWFQRLFHNIIIHTDIRAFALHRQCTLGSI